MALMKNDIDLIVQSLLRSNYSKEKHITLVLIDLQCLFSIHPTI